jgi:hypothetical protein
MISGARSVSRSKRAAKDGSRPISRARSETDLNLPSSKSFCHLCARAIAMTSASWCEGRIGLSAANACGRITSLRPPRFVSSGDPVDVELKIQFCVLVPAMLKTNVLYGIIQLGEQGAFTPSHFSSPGLTGWGFFCSCFLHLLSSVLIRCFCRHVNSPARHAQYYPSLQQDLDKILVVQKSREVNLTRHTIRSKKLVVR